MNASTKRKVVPMTPPHTENDGPSRNHEHVKVKYLKMLADALGNHAAVGREIGLTGGTVSESLRNGKTKKVNELAAQLIWEQDYAKASGKKVAAVVIASQKTIEFLQTLMEREGGEFTILKGIKAE